MAVAVLWVAVYLLQRPTRRAKILFMKKFGKKYLLTTIGVVIGATAGYLYWRFAGCTGTCAITSSPLNSSVYGASLGGLLFSLFKKSHKETT